MMCETRPADEGGNRHLPHITAGQRYANFSFRIYRGVFTVNTVSRYSA